jgi:hypothetical protein
VGHGGVNVGRKNRHQQQDEAPRSRPPSPWNKKAKPAKNLSDPANQNQQPGGGQSRRNDARILIWNNKVHASSDEKKKGQYHPSLRHSVDRAHFCRLHAPMIAQMERTLSSAPLAMILRTIPTPAVGAPLGGNEHCLSVYLWRKSGPQIPPVSLRWRVGMTGGNGKTKTGRLAPSRFKIKSKIKVKGSGRGRPLHTTSFTSPRSSRPGTLPARG